MAEKTKAKTETVSIRLDTDRVDYLKKMSHYISLERGDDLQYTDLIREAIDSTFPMPPADASIGDSKGMDSEKQND